MSIKLVRFIAALAIIASIAGTSGVAHADASTPTSAGSQKPELHQAGYQPLNIPALLIPPISLPGVQFVHVATAANIDAHTTIIDNPLTNGNPLALLIVTPNWNPGGVNGTYNNHYVGVFYNFNRSQWGIYNEDNAPMAVGEAFNVFVPTSSTGASVQTASSVSNSVIITDPMATNNPNAIILVTPIWNPGGGVRRHERQLSTQPCCTTTSLNKWASHRPKRRGRCRPAPRSTCSPSTREPGQLCSPGCNRVAPAGIATNIDRHAP